MVKEVTKSNSPKQNNEIYNLKEKTNQIKNFLVKNKIKYFTDLDDTISDNKTMFYSKLKFLLKIKKLEDKLAFDIILKDFNLNDLFIKKVTELWINSLFILSRNDDWFVQYFIEQTKWIFKKHWIEIVWWIWRSKYFKLHTQDKISLLPNWSILISDIFEYKKLKNYKNFVCIEDYSFPKYCYKTLLKLFRFFIFVIKNII